MRALNLLRPQPVYRRDAFTEGLRAAGYTVVGSMPNPGVEDVLVIWNRYGAFQAQAERFEAAGSRVLVAENAYLPGLGGETWFALSIGHHAGAGVWPKGGSERWDSLGVRLADWRRDEGEPLILAQRGIGEHGVASPTNWAESVKKRIGGRIRPHPGRHAPTVPLDRDLAGVSCIATWASSAALLGLTLGVPVWYEMPTWIGAGAAKPLAEWGQEHRRDDSARLATFRSLIWAQWRLPEIADGTAFKALLC